jgi:hypothetical protein
VPADAALQGLRSLDRLGPAAVGKVGETDLLSLLGFPDFLREGRARAARHPGSAVNGLPGAEQVLGEQATLTDLGEGGGLTFGQLPLLAFALVLFSSVLLLSAVLPPGVVSRARLSPASYARARQPLVLASIGILVPVALVALIVALS